MFKHHLKLAFRNLLREKLYSVINITGLAIVITSCIFILLYVTDELNFDRFHSKAENIYRIRHQYFMGDQDYDWPETSPLLADRMRNQFPEVEMVTSITAPGVYTFRHKADLLGDIQTVQADAYFLEVFDFHLLAGEKSTALSEPNDIVISEKVALQFFEEEINNVGYDAIIGKTLISNGDIFSIKGILQNVPENSHLQFDVLVSIYHRLKNAYVSTTWLPAGIHHYAVLKENVSHSSLEAKFTQVEKEFLWTEMQQTLGTSINILESNTDRYGYSLEPLLDIHLVREGNLRYVYAFSAIGLLIFLLGIINFVNLHTARIATRSREVGVRKILGSSKITLISQFLTEAFSMCLIATVMALALVQLFQHPFKNLASKNIDFSVWYQPISLFYILGFVLLIGLFSGIYPAVVLSSFKPASVLKGAGRFVKTGKESWNLRSFFTVFQFVISIGLIITAFGLYQQLEYMREKDPGFNKDQVLVISDAYSLGENGDVFKHSLLNHPGVESASISYAVPSSTFDWLAIYQKAGDDKEHQFHVMEADFDFIETFGLTMIQGRPFSKEFTSDSSSILLNETAANHLGITGVLGSELKNHFDKKYRVIGIIKDFNFEHLKNEIKPLAITLNTKSSFSLFVSVRLKAANTQETIHFIEKQWQAYNHDAPFTYTFLDDKFNSQFKIEVQTGNVMGVLTGLAIFIACLGLFGMSTYTAEQRTKEIGIRKALGASVKSITLLLSKEFVKLVLIAFLIAIPFAWLVLHQWLQNFANRIPITSDIFILPGILVVVIAWWTVCYQSIKAARANPVDSLKSE